MLWIGSYSFSDFNEKGFRPTNLSLPAVIFFPFSTFKRRYFCFYVKKSFLLRITYCQQNWTSLFYTGCLISQWQDFEGKFDLGLSFIDHTFSLNMGQFDNFLTTARWISFSTVFATSFFVEETKHCFLYDLHRYKIEKWCLQAQLS